MVNRASKRYLLPGYSRRRNSYCWIAEWRILSSSKRRPISTRNSATAAALGSAFVDVHEPRLRRGIHAPGQEGPGEVATAEPHLNARRVQFDLNCSLLRTVNRLGSITWFCLIAQPHLIKQLRS